MHVREPLAENAAHTVSAAEGYERWASGYDHTPNPLLAREERYLLPLLPPLHNKAVLDLACGTGRWLQRFRAKGATLGVGIDNSISMLRVAASKHGVQARVVRASCENIPISMSVFDLAICSFAVGHIIDLDSMVRELTRVMKPAADIFASDLHPDAYAHGWRVGFREGGAAFEIEMRSRSHEEIREAFCANGFRCERQVPLWLEDPEQPLFARAGKAHLFSAACQIPAVLISHFRRLES
jgi:malonyl-CoA O-methyltransferase